MTRTKKILLVVGLAALPAIAWAASSLSCPLGCCPSACEPSPECPCPTGCAPSDCG